MKVINYKDNQVIRKDVSSLYVSAFPREERPPVNMFFASVELDNDDLLAFYDNNKFIGFTNLIFYKDIIYIFFLAVKDEYRNKGYGSKILQYLKESYKDKVLTLCYDPRF